MFIIEVNDDQNFEVSAKAEATNNNTTKVIDLIIYLYVQKEFYL